MTNTKYTGNNRTRLWGKRRSCGSVIIEFLAMIPFIVVFALLALDLAVILAAVRVNDIAARNCARAAAQAESLAEARQAVQSVIRSFASKQSSLISSPKVSIDGLQYEDYAAQNHDPSLGPFVWVKTTTRTRLPFPVPVFGTMVGLNQEVTLQQAYAFPIITLRLNPDSQPELAKP